jgi:uncharacterized membrane protein SpoIIM required for sporulation
VDDESETEPSELSELYAQITDDLSYARTYYSKRSIRVYLNNQAQKVFLSLYKQRTGRMQSFASFWSERLPLALYRSRKELNISLVFFIVSTAIGVFSSIHDPDFARVILGDEYIDMTNENIANGDPMAVYKSAGEFDMFFRITFNNILVAFRTFVLGAFFGIGTLIIMLYNGIMVGTFQYYFVEQALFKESFLTIWMHGALEISAIVIAGGAGLTMGRGLVYPGTLPRLQSFQIAARRAITIMLGLIPIFIGAGFIEGFFTRITDLPDTLRASFIFLSFSFIGIYFWWFPWAKYRGQKTEPYDPEQLVPTIELPLDLQLVRKGKEVFSGAFTLFRKLFVPLFLFAAGAAAVYCIAFRLIYGAAGVDQIYFAKFSIYNLYQFHSYETFFWNFFLNIALISAAVWFSMVQFRKHFTEQIGKEFKTGWSLLLKITVVVTLFELCILSQQSLVATIGILILPYLAFLIAVTGIENISIQKGFSRMGNLLSGTKRNIFVTYASIAVLSVMLLFLFDSPFTWFYIDVVQWNISGDDALKQEIATLSLLFVNQLGLGLVVPLILFGQVLEYFSAKEAKEAPELSTRVVRIGEKRKAYGMERE